jgi:predicted AAA+ superfamily ATPase
MNYLRSLCSEVYLKDIVERKKVEREDVLSQVLDMLCSSIGSLTNPTKIANTLKSRSHISISQNTIKSYIRHLSDAFLFAESKRYDVKGNAYFDSSSKYYCKDIGLRNARIGFQQQEITHIIENILYNELVLRRLSVDVGVVYSQELNQNNNSVRVPREIDFIVNGGGKKTYIQSASAMETEEKREMETKPFSLAGDSFPKIIVRKDTGKRWYDDKGILHIGLLDFLLDDSVI